MQVISTARYELENEPNEMCTGNVRFSRLAVSYLQGTERIMHETGDEWKKGVIGNLPRVEGGKGKMSCVQYS